jgi:threonylcarbamoyladenosine tRNA methylthiotransferase MtaB
MPHFHVPLQSGSNTILGMMRRRYRRELYAERVKLIKSLMPHCAIGADVIVGFPAKLKIILKKHLISSILSISRIYMFLLIQKETTPMH